MIKKIGKSKIIFSLILFLYLVFMLGSATFADEVTVTCEPKLYTIYNYRGCASGYPTNTIASGHNVGGGDIDEVWYYAIPNYKSEAINVNFQLYGPVTAYGSDKTYVKNLYVDFTDSIPANKIRMYFYTVFTADKSYEASEVHSVDISLNTNNEITEISNFRSLVAVSMGDDGDNEVDVKYYLSKEEIEDTGLNPPPQHYGYEYNASNPHYIQFLYPDSGRTISLHTFVKSGARPIGTSVGDRARIISELSGFNGKEVYTIYSSTSNTYYYSSNVIVNNHGRSTISREQLGHLVITYDKQDGDRVPPTVSLFTDVNVTNQNTIRVYANATDDRSGIDPFASYISGFFGEGDNAVCFTNRNCWIS